MIKKAKGMDLEMPKSISCLKKRLKKNLDSFLKLSTLSK